MKTLTPPAFGAYTGSDQTVRDLLKQREDFIVSQRQDVEDNGVSARSHKWTVGILVVLLLIATGFSIYKVILPNDGDQIAAANADKAKAEEKLKITSDRLDATMKIATNFETLSERAVKESKEAEAAKDKAEEALKGANQAKEKAEAAINKEQEKVSTLNEGNKTLTSSLTAAESNLTLAKGAAEAAEKAKADLEKKIGELQKQLADATKVAPSMPAPTPAAVASATVVQPPVIPAVGGNTALDAIFSRAPVGDKGVVRNPSEPQWKGTMSIYETNMLSDYQKSKIAGADYKVLQAFSDAAAAFHAARDCRASTIQCSYLRRFKTNRTDLTDKDREDIDAALAANAATGGVHTARR